MRTKSSSSSLRLLFLLLLSLFLLVTPSLAFQSDELLADDDEFGLEGARSPDPASLNRPTSLPRRRLSDSVSDPDSKIQFSLEHAFGDSDFSPAGTFSARVKTSTHGGQTLTKLRFSREVFSDTQKENFKRLLEGDDFYRIRLPSNVLSPPGRDYIISSVKARCLPRDALDEHFIIHMLILVFLQSPKVVPHGSHFSFVLLLLICMQEGVNILAVNYGSPGSCQYPRQMKLPTKWSFKSHTVLKNSDQAPRTPVFTEEVIGENGEGEEVKLPERSFWAKYWMYLIPLGLIVMNAMTQAMNMPEEAANGQPASQTQQVTAGRGQATAVRRR
ncbi:hypothetical protein BUALT_Bualt01G0114000 [Buddleja alternifolia]|uniref:ER membrane protein complex subunit 10 n=1 Tax=Buddleja alternifolia TaxID=168488 RepID=A0AAV6YC83_9LAMI|nr:hypothetical protein BUALT_Bualt01G0114000 [Buddleja alternifolia]